MLRKLSLLGAVTGSSVMLTASAAWGATSPVRDAGDAGAAKVGLRSSQQLVHVVRDSGDATIARLGIEGQYLATPISVVRDDGDATQARLTLKDALGPYIPSTSNGWWPLFR